MQDGYLDSFIEEIREYLGSHAHITANSSAGPLISLTCSSDGGENPEQYAALAQLEGICETVGDGDGLAVVLRTMIVEDPDGEGPALCTIRGYIFTPERWVRLASEEMRENYSPDADTGLPLEPDYNLVFA